MILLKRIFSWGGQKGGNYLGKKIFLRKEEICFSSLIQHFLLLYLNWSMLMKNTDLFLYKWKPGGLWGPGSWVQRLTLYIDCWWKCKKKMTWNIIFVIVGNLGVYGKNNFDIILLRPQNHLNQSWMKCYLDFLFKICVIRVDWIQNTARQNLTWYPMCKFIKIFKKKLDLNYLNN